MYGYIYITTNKINGKIYIGQHKAVQYDSWYLGSGTYLRNAIQKYGKENFENHIIQWCISQEELNDKEKYWIKKYNSLDKAVGYNITKGGTNGGIQGLKQEDYENWLKRISEKSKLTWSNPENRKKLSNSVKISLNNPETKKKMSDNMKYQWERPEYREKMSEKLSIAGKKTWQNPEYKEKMKAKLKEAQNRPETLIKRSKASSKKVVVILPNGTQEIFNSRQDADKKYNHSVIKRCLTTGLSYNPKRLDKRFEKFVGIKAKYLNEEEKK